MIDTDVAIVGGGIIGCLIARELVTRAPGMAITLLDRDLVGSGASRRAAGLHFPRWATMRVRAITAVSHATPPRPSPRAPRIGGGSTSARSSSSPLPRPRTGTCPYREQLQRFFSAVIRSEAANPQAARALFDPNTGAYLYEGAVTGGCTGCGATTAGNICEQRGWTGYRPRWRCWSAA
ncbi:FAD-dependent oxidoreductase [Nocardia sp. NPDC051052]|uniref:FAD-dependent oxidoreductase n=1 Tax=Nocardia sp. NPDC051052 TaxID=3364322 RepID=UPI0037AB4C98